MTVRECLERPGKIRQAISIRLMRIEMLQKYSVRLSSGLNQVRVKSSPDPTRMQALLAEAADEEKEVTRLEAELSQASSEAAILISRLPDMEMIRLLELRYLECQGWPETAMSLNRSLNGAYKLHRRALDLLQRIMASCGERK